MNKVVAGTVLGAAETISNDPRNTSDEDGFDSLYDEIRDYDRFSGHQKFSGRVFQHTIGISSNLDDSDDET